jgi:hypothetical protein
MWRESLGWHLEKLAKEKYENGFKAAGEHNFIEIITGDDKLLSTCHSVICFGFMF